MTDRCKGRCVLLLMFHLLLLSHAGDAGERPNVIVMMADDIGFECYSHKGSEFYSTPNIDRLAEIGAEFVQAYSQPICTPSRVRIMTGRYNFRNYTRFGELDLSQPTFAGMVQRNGYATAIAGKWQLSPGNLQGPHDAGFDEYLLWHFSAAHGNRANADELPRPLRKKGSRYRSPTLFRNGQRLRGTAEKYGPDLVTDFICEFIERKKDQPFLVYYPMLLTHAPFTPTPLSADWGVDHSSREPVEYFREMVSYMDRMVGKIVRKLDDEGLREKTLVLVTGDNGTDRRLSSPLPSRGVIRGGKGTMKDAGNRVAFVANWPGVIEPGTVVDAPIGFADVLPTIAEVTGSKLPAAMDGESLVSLMKGDSSGARAWMFQSYAKGSRGRAPFRCFVRNANWKLYADGLLYNVPNDWLEQSPAASAEAQAARQRLQPVLDRIIADAPAGVIDRGHRPEAE